MTQYPAFRDSGQTPDEFVRSIVEMHPELRQKAEDILNLMPAIQPTHDDIAITLIGQGDTAFPRWLLIQDTPDLIIVAKLIGDVDLLATCREETIRNIQELKGSELNTFSDRSEERKRLWQSVVAQPALNALERHIDAAIIKADKTIELPPAMKAPPASRPLPSNDGFMEI
jgi:hypothetical protein